MAHLPYSPVPSRSPSLSSFAAFSPRSARHRTRLGRSARLALLGLVAIVGVMLLAWRGGGGGTTDAWEVDEGEREAWEGWTSWTGLWSGEETNAGNEGVEVMPLPGKGDDRTLPACTKTLLFRFAGLHGAGSELSLALRVGALASHFGYTLLLDSSSWNYGSLESYFLPFPPLVPSTHDECRPPPSTTKRSKLVLSPADSASLQSLLSSSQDPRASGWVPAWTSRNHLVWHQRDMDGLDQTILALFTAAPDLEAMHGRDLDELKTGTKGRIGGLEPRDTVPEVFGEVFERLAKEAARVWRVNEEVAGSVKALEERLGFGRRAGRGTQGEGKEAGDLVVGVHVR
ncbi:hypothetical protein JCM21900_005513 [Sporobolomyces salmonicolor]